MSSVTGFENVATPITSLVASRALLKNEFSVICGSPRLRNDALLFRQRCFHRLDEMFGESYLSSTSASPSATTAMLRSRSRFRFFFVEGALAALAAAGGCAFGVG